jgi:hypothetical protein
MGAEVGSEPQLSPPWGLYTPLSCTVEIPRKDWHGLVRAGMVTPRSLELAWLQGFPNAPLSLHSVPLISTVAVSLRAGPGVQRGRALLAQDPLMREDRYCWFPWDDPPTEWKGFLACTDLLAKGVVNTVGCREFDEHTQLQTPKKQLAYDPEVWTTAPPPDGCRSPARK